MTPDPDELERLGRRLLQIADQVRESDDDAGRPGTPVPDPSTCNPPDWLIRAGAGRAGRPVPLQGTPRQVAWADRLRHTRLSYLRHRGDTRALAACCVIKDASWWIGNNGTPLAEISWPTKEQVEMATAAVTGGDGDGDDNINY